MIKFLKSLSFTCFDPDATDRADIAAKDVKTFTQEQVNTFLADEKRKSQVKQREMATELENLKKNTTLTTEERDTLQNRIEELQNQFMTKEEQARQASEKNSKKTAEDLKTLTTERDTWRNKHSQLLVDTEITKAAADNKAFSTEQISAILTPKTKLSEILDDTGKPLGIFEPRVMFSDKDKDDKPVVLELTVNDAVKRMTELPQYGNLFEGDKKGGFGGSGSSVAGKKVNLAKIAKDPVAYRKLRKERPELFV